MLRERLELEIPYIGREMKPTPAVASEKMHKQEQEKIMIAALGLPSDGAAARKAPPKARVKTAKPVRVGGASA
jgi:hypothetical protein